MGFLDSLFGKKPASNKTDSPEYSDNDKSIIHESATRLATIVYESIELAKTSSNPSTKVYRVKVANEKLEQLKGMADEYPFLSIDSLPEVEQEISRISIDLESTGYTEMAEWNEAGQALENEGKIDEAIEQYRILVDKGVDTPFCYRRLAILYRKRKMKDAEVFVLKSALENIPQSNAKHHQWFKDRYDKVNPE